MHIKGKPAWIFTQSVLHKVKSEKKIRVCSSKHQFDLEWVSRLDQWIACQSCYSEVPWGFGISFCQNMGEGWATPTSTNPAVTVFWASIQLAQGHFYSRKIAKNLRISKKFGPNSKACICEVLSPRDCVSRGFAVLCPAPPVPPALQSPFMSIHPICSGSFLQP